MNSNIILEFLKRYKNLDELCRQILSSDRGVSEYIDEMSNENQGYRIAGWESDYKKLKKMRWIRNRLVHEINSFEDNLVSEEDIEWLHTFYHRIMECTDPFSLLHQSEKTDRKTSKQEKCPEKTYVTNKASYSRNGDLLGRPLARAVLTCAIIVGVILLGIVILSITILF